MIGIFSLLFAVAVCRVNTIVALQSNVSNPDHLTASSPVVKSAVKSAVSWLIKQRAEPFNWADQTHRAVVALTMAEEVAPLTKTQKELMTKQLTVLLSLELEKSRHSWDIGISKLALYMNALYATCQNPTSFHGLDLVRILRNKVDVALRNSSGDFNLPIVFLPLCFAKEVSHRDLDHVIRAHQHHLSKPDMQAIDLMAMSCFTQLSRFNTNRKYFDAQLTKFMRDHSHLGKHADVYSLALAIQAMNSGNEPVDLSPLISKQLEDGSFGSLLATYYAIPALMGKSLVSLKDRVCAKESLKDRFDTPLMSGNESPRVYYSLWLGNDSAHKNTHTVTVDLKPNSTFYDIMLIAQDKSDLFKFEASDSVSFGKRVFQLSGQPNDPERQIYWILYLAKNEPKEPHASRLLQIHAGVDKIVPMADDHFVFWFKRSSMF